tara:strand:- start:1920 stop:2534 length:615 start_codon:yes stop_codon:yes gene_type:complete
MLTTPNRTNDLAYVTIDELIDQLDGAWGLTPYTVASSARVYAELERRGYDLSKYARGIGKFLPQVARGEVAPELVVALMADPTRILIAAALPWDQQIALAADGRIDIADIGGEGATSVPLDACSASQLGQAIDETTGTIRSPDEQREMAKQRPARTRPKQTRLTLPAHVLDKIRITAIEHSITPAEYVEKLVEKCDSTETMEAP